MAEAGGWRAGPPTCSPSLPGCSGPGHALDSSTGGLGSRDLGVPSTAAPGAWDPGTWARPRQQHRGLGSRDLGAPSTAAPGGLGCLPGPVVNSGNGGRTGSRPSCFVCGGKGGGQEGPVADGLCPVPARGA